MLWAGEESTIDRPLWSLGGSASRHKWRITFSQAMRWMSWNADGPEPLHYSKSTFALSWNSSL